MGKLLNYTAQKTQTFVAYFAKKHLTLALCLSVLISLTPMLAGALSIDVTTAKSNETSTGNVLGGKETRVTWEAIVDQGEEVSSVTVSFPQGSSFTENTTLRVTVIEGSTRLEYDIITDIDADNISMTATFSQAVDAGKRIQFIMTNVCLPNESGKVTLSGAATHPDGSIAQADLNESGNVYITVSEMSLAEQITDWMDNNPIIQAWDSVKFLNLFIQPQLIVNSIPTVFWGWLISLMLVLIGFPLAIPIGLVSAFMKISKFRILHFIAAIYTGVIRGTPLFLQIYIAFFGLPMMGINVNQYLLSILVLAFNSGAYLCEIFRAGIQSIHKGQFEAARSLGMNSMQTMFSVIIPQTIRRVIPTMTSEFILLYKDTSLLAAVGVMELMLYSRHLVANTGNMTPYIVAALFYLVVTLPLIQVVTVFENKLALADSGTAPQQKTRKNRRDAFAQMAEEVEDTLELRQPVSDTPAPKPQGGQQ